MASDKKKAARMGAHIVFVDESGFQLTPSLRRTWAPRGRTPSVRHWQRRDKVSAISGLSVSPARKRVGLYWQLHRDNARRDEVCGFLRHLLRHLRGRVIVVWDNSNTHKGEPIRELCRDFGRLHIEALPPYAPELNPDEGVWASLKGVLANGCPDDVDELARDLVDSLCELKRCPATLRSCFHRSDLPPLLH